MDNYTATEIAYKNGYDKGYEEATNRQKAEVRKLTNAYDQIKWERDMFEDDLQTTKAEIERLQKAIKVQEYTFNNLIEKIMTEWMNRKDDSK